MNRRRLLLSGGALVGLGACQTSPTPSQLTTDVNLIASGLSAAIRSIAAIPGVPAADVARLNTYLATIQADAAAVAGETATPVTGTVQEIGQVVQAVAAVALPIIPGGSAILPVIQAAISLLPVILASVGASGAGVVATFSPDQARLILAAAGK